MSSGKEFAPLPPNMYQVEIFAAETYEGAKFHSTEIETKLKLTLVILDEDKTMVEGSVEIPVRGRRLWARMPARFSIPGSKKATNLTKMVAVVFGHEFEQAEVDAFDEADLIGKQVCVLVDAKPSDDGTVWNNVLSFSKASKQMPKYDELSDHPGSKETVTKKSEPVDTKGFEEEMDELMASKAKK